MKLPLSVTLNEAAAHVTLMPCTELGVMAKVLEPMPATSMGCGGCGDYPYVHQGGAWTGTCTSR